MRQPVTHYLAPIAVGVAVTLLATLFGWVGRAIIRRLDDIVGLPEAVKQLAAAISSWDEFRVDVDRRLTAHDRQLASQGQRVTALETKVHP